MRRLLFVLLSIVLLATGQSLLASAPAQAADTGNAAPHPGKVVSDEPGRNTPHILDGTVNSVAKVGHMIVVGGSFSQVQNYGTSVTLTRRNLFAFDSVSGKISTTFAPDPLGAVYKVLPAADGTSVYVGGGFGFAYGTSMPSRLFKARVSDGARDATFNPPTISGDVRDLDLASNRLWVAGKFTHLGGVAQKALGTLNPSTGTYDNFFTAVMDGVRRTNRPEDRTNVLKIASNPSNTQMTVMGNFTSVNGTTRWQVAQFDISGATATLAPWYTTLFQSSCSSSFETYMTDVEYSPNGQFFVFSTTGAWGGMSSATGGNGCDVVARFESASTSPTSVATWTAYTGGDTTWTVEVTDDVVYAGGHQNWQNNPIGSNVPAQGAVSREGIAALSTVNGLPLSWNPTRARGVGVQDMLATSDGLYVGSDTELIGHTAGNTYHGRIALLPLAGATKLPQIQTNSFPLTLYRVSSGASQLTRRTFTGTTVGTTTNAPTGPGWSTSTGAFMANGVLYKTNSDGSLSKMTFDGTTYGTATAVNTADALVNQTDWHNDVKTITTIFYADGWIYYTKSGTNALYRRGFEVESGVVGQQRFQTTTTSINWSGVRGAFVAGGKFVYATSAGNLWSINWNQGAHNVVTGTGVQLTGAGTGWASRAMFPYQAVPAPLNEAPLADAYISCDELVCSFDGTTSSDPEAGALSYDWDFGDGTAHGAGATTTHTYSSPGDRPVTLRVTDNQGATASITKTASPSDVADPISFVARTTSNGNRANHTVAVPPGTQVGDTLLLFFAANSIGPVYTGPAGWQEVETENGSSFVGKLYAKTATASDLGSSAMVTSRRPDATAYYVRSDTTMAAYRGVGSPAVDVSAITSQNFTGAVHQTPIVTAADGTGWLVSYWTDKSSATTTWTGPSNQTQRSLGTGTGSNHMSSLLMDSNGRVNTGGQGGLNATANSSAQGLTMSVLLSSSEPAPPNQNPVANAGTASCSGTLTCSFDGSSSFDPEGGALTYDWDWGDGTAHGTTATPSHTFTTGGDKTVTLTVSDPLGAISVDTVVANAVAPPVNAAPTARITNRSCTNLVCSFDGSTSTDPDPDTLTYSWDFGDGTPAATTSNPTHTYATAGEKTVTLTVDDGNGHSDDDSTTFTVTAPPPVNAAPTAAITNASCTDLACSFTGSTSSDPDGDTLTYSWDFGDGSAAVTTTNASHTYATAGARTVTLTVDDGQGHTDSDSVTANPTEPDPDPASNIAYVGSSSTNGNRVTHAAPIPGGVNLGDTLVVFFTANTTNPTYTPPAGWTQLESANGNGIVTRAWTRAATAADLEPNARVVVTSSSYAKSDITVAAYRGTDGTSPIATSASRLDNASGAAHTSPAVTATDDASWLVTYWADKSSDTTGWTAPGGQSVRQAVPTTSSSGHITALLTDSNGPVASGPRGELTATANSTSSRGASFSVLLKSS